MVDPDELTDQELVNAAWGATTPEERDALRLAAAQRGLWPGADMMDPRERQRRREEGPGR